MPKTMAVWTVVILGFMICWGAAGQAQEAEQVKPTGEGKAVAAPEKPVHAYRLDFSVRELEEGKTINTRQYSLNLNADDSNEIKIGTWTSAQVSGAESESVPMASRCR